MLNLMNIETSRNNSSRNTFIKLSTISPENTDRNMDRNESRCTLQQIKMLRDLYGRVEG